MDATSDGLKVKKLNIGSYPMVGLFFLGEALSKIPDWITEFFSAFHLFCNFMYYPPLNLAAMPYYPSIQEQIEAVRQAGEIATQSKESARAFLVAAGILKEGVGKIKEPPKKK